ncbi:hypothetical protein BS333_21130 (plasmid) [Vibrio azureus]|uniref:Uncharacterized protein n=1 Tax=Vibrio azureus NBRC 104587 TaxID=1219077 RepID=U3C9L8_9VIBR|nr:hypothetical protein BS333_21130 [Vibrio azureus]GAD78059.1 hypothetical protein VAZ01S_118_00020 [Vibrio azureus NBRC 104587]
MLIKKLFITSLIILTNQVQVNLVNNINKENIVVNHLSSADTLLTCPIGDIYCDAILRGL